MPLRRGVLLLGALLLVAAPAQAAGGITAPTPGEVVTTHGLVPLRAVVEGPAAQPSELVLVEPGSEVEQVVSVSTDPGGGELAYDLDTACAQPACAGEATARNGTWTLRLRGAAADERGFDLRIPPLAPQDLTASPAEGGALLQWRRGAEPDLTGYTVVDAAGAAARFGLDACTADGGCRATVAGGDSWQVLAHRTTCPSCHEELSSPPAQVQLGAGAPVVGLPAPEQSGGSTGTAVPDQRGAFARAFGVARPRPAPVPRPTGVTAPAPVPDGTYDVELGYGEPQPARGPSGTSVDDALAVLATPDRLGLVVVSGLLVGVALWLRRWARRVIDE